MSRSVNVICDACGAHVPAEQGTVQQLLSAGHGLPHVDTRIIAVPGGVDISLVLNGSMRLDVRSPRDTSNPNTGWYDCDLCDACLKAPLLRMLEELTASIARQFEPKAEPKP